MKPYDRLKRAGALALCAVSLAGTGCERWKPKALDHYVYVTAKGANLRDRVAAVSNRTGTVQNGDKLRVLDHGRHWVKVETPKGETGWIEEKAVATEEAAGDFDKLRDEHKGDVPVASAVVRDTVYMHLRPGKDSEHFYLLPEGEKLKLLRRATLIKTSVNPATVARAQKKIPQAAGSDASRKDAVVAPVVAPEGDVPAPPAMEDWWLVQDSQGHTGWLFARMLDVDAPDALTRYAEGQKIVGAYVLTTVHDDGAPGGPADIPIYVTVLSAYKAGLPYDFDQVRVFTWSLQRHRYETGFRDKNIEGYLPLVISKSKDASEKGPLGEANLPTFRYNVLTADAPAVVPDPVTGAMVATKTMSKTYRLEGNGVRRVGYAAGPAWASGSELEAHPAVEEKKDKKGKKKR